MSMDPVEHMYRQSIADDIFREEQFASRTLHEYLASGREEDQRKSIALSGRIMGLQRARDIVTKQGPPPPRERGSR